VRILITRRERLDIPDGINIFIFSLADSLTRLGHTVFLLSTYQSNMERIAKYYGGFRFEEVYGLMDHAVSSPCTLRGVFMAWVTRGRMLIRKLKPDFCIFNGAVPFMPTDIPHVFVAHDLERRFVRSQWLQTLIKRIAYRSAVQVVAATSEAGSQ
jgi:hypothetical protein